MYCKIYINETSRINIDVENITYHDIFDIINDYFVYDKIIINKITECSGYVEVFVSAVN
jgi:hypothetical protein